MVMRVLFSILLLFKNVGRYGYFIKPNLRFVLVVNIQRPVFKLVQLKLWR